MRGWGRQKRWCLSLVSCAFARRQERSTKSHETYEQLVLVRVCSWIVFGGERQSLELEHQTDANKQREKSTEIPGLGALAHARASDTKSDGPTR